MINFYANMLYIFKIGEYSMDHQMLSLKKTDNKFIQLMQKYKNEIIIFIVMIFLCCLRIYFGNMVGNFFASEQGADDALMINYSFLKSHFHFSNSYSLVKTMSYPLFLKFCYVTHINYTLMVSLVWIFTAFIYYFLFKKIFHNKILEIFSFCYILFFPTAFELWVGTRIYRNAIIAPFVLITFGLLFLNLYDIVSKNTNIFFLAVRSIILGIFFTFTYYIKEDGLWILACLLFFSVIATFFCIFKKKRKMNKLENIQCIICLVIPFMIFFVGTVTYKSINNHYFGVKEIQTRTDGELGDFTSYVYQVDSSKQTPYVWAPADSIKKIIEVSPTLKKYPQITNDLLESTPIYGDFLTWNLRASLQNNNLWTSEKDVDNLFRQINEEIKSAFDEGKLKKSSKFQPFSDAGGRNWNEMLELLPLVHTCYYNAIILQNYNPGAAIGNTVDPIVAQKASIVTRIDYLTNYSSRKNSNLEKTNLLIKKIFLMYSIINCLCFCMSIFMVVFSLVRLLKQKNKKDWSIREEKILWIDIIIIALFAISFAYTFSISWFAEFVLNRLTVSNETILIFYSIALPSILGIIYLLTLGNFFQLKNLTKKSNSLFNHK